MFLHRERDQVQTGNPAFRPTHQPLQLFFRERRGEHLAQKLTCFALLEAQFVRTNLDQLPVGSQTRKRQVWVHAAGEDQMQMSGQMLQEEGHALVNARLFDHLIIVQKEDDGSRMRRRSFQLMEKHGKTGGKRRWLGRLQLCHHIFPKVRCQTGAAAQGRDQRDPEACRAVVQFVQREPGNVFLVLACPGREQGRLAPARRGRKQCQRSRQRPIERGV